MSKTNSWEDDLLNLLFLNTAATLIGDAAGLQPSGAAGSLYISLHTADPGEAGNQSTSEAAYTGYARIAVARNGAAWSVSSGTVTNLSGITFGTCTGGTATVTYFGIGTDAVGAGKLLYVGALTVGLSISSGVTPLFNAGDLTVTED
jgi:hypothetical protein